MSELYLGNTSSDSDSDDRVFVVGGLRFFACVVVCACPSREAELSTMVPRVFFVFFSLVPYVSPRTPAFAIAANVPTPDLPAPGVFYVVHPLAASTR